MKRRATARWRGNTEGHGTLSTLSGALKNVSYSFAQRFGDEPGTNPEELIAAAHAGCFTMALAAELDKRQLKAASLEVQAAVHLQQPEGQWTITGVELQLTADVPGAAEKDIREAAESAKTNCPVSRLLNAEIDLHIHGISDEESGDDEPYIERYAELG